MDDQPQWSSSNHTYKRILFFFHSYGTLTAQGWPSKLLNHCLPLLIKKKNVHVQSTSLRHQTKVLSLII